VPVLPDYPDPTVYAVPYFLVTLVLEGVVLRRMKARGRDVLGHVTKDSWASLAMGLGSLVTVGLVNAGIYGLAKVLWEHRLLDLGEGALGWTVALVGWDFSFYWHHRVEHENRVLWACHVNHHSSQLYNLTTALRQPWTPFAGLFFFPPWALLGVSPKLVMISGGLNLVYQYGIHTEMVGKLWRPIEWVFNTPSHHRVHHGSNPEYLDKNYGGVLIVWDRLFGTFAEEKARVIYGLTKNITSYNPFVIAFHEYVAIARDVVRAPSWRVRVGILWHGPAWHPG
jgi:sterol desaturase/sphingolipid hydroxylase (fatty acid hydroxylase superfamily)